MEHRRTKHEKSLEERLANRAHHLSDEANKLPPGDERDNLIRRVQQAEVACRINEWLNSPGLASPK
jgi:hypothetical protein